MIDVLVRKLCAAIVELGEEDRIDALNRVRIALHDVSPLRDQPVDLVLWVRAETVRGNEYNPNAVAPPEMRLLTHSVLANGYTMPIVTHEIDETSVEVVDGFHRQRVGKEIPEVRERCHGRLPVTRIRADRADAGARIAATIEHNRARGEHQVDRMSEVVRMLYQQGWSEQRIMQELGMEADEVLRLKQMTGLAELFRDRQFSEAWEPES
jgi:ParB-like chromosome segregation protein Spo0J